MAFDAPETLTEYVTCPECGALVQKLKAVPLDCPNCRALDYELKRAYA